MATDVDPDDVSVKVLRIYHAGRDRAHRARERALARAGAEVTLVVPRNWPDHGSEGVLSAEPDIELVELAVRRAGDVNRHGYTDPDELRRLVQRVSPDVLDLHEEPVSVAAREWLAATRHAAALPVLMYTAQNIDKRFPPPFHAYERAALRRADGVYPCSTQAASVARGKGFEGLVEVLPLGLDLGLFTPGDRQAVATGDELVLGLVGRIVPEKGVDDAVHVLAGVLRSGRAARLELVGSGPALSGALELAGRLGVGAQVRHTPWVDADSLAAAYRGMDVVLVPSRATATWVEQFGRVVLEAQAAGAVVVGYASGAIPEVLQGGGVLVPEGDVAELGRAVQRLLDEPTRMAALRAAGLANAHAAGWESVARRQVGLYEEVIRAAPQRQRQVRPVTSPSQRRAAAVAEFGPPARVLGQDRPFALPVLRDSSALGRFLGRAVDRLTR